MQRKSISIERWSTLKARDPLVKALRFLHDEGLVGTNDLASLAKALGLDLNLVLAKRQVLFRVPDGTEIDVFLPMIVTLSYTDQKKKIFRINFEVQGLKVHYFDGDYGDVTVMTPAQFLNHLAKCTIPFREFTYLNYVYYSPDYIYTAQKLSFYYEIYMPQYKTLKANIVEPWAAKYAKSQLLKLPEGNDVLYEYARKSDEGWWMYPWVKTTDKSLEMPKLKNLSIKLGIPLQVLKYLRSEEDVDVLADLYKISKDRLKQALEKLRES